ncbi:MAG: PBP1A family penicillin-binding protein [Candidatus Desulfofervidaceae bacterium]|nr:PBP1A family penicillin-binding protein [Candidatus Desulfofervidaceae bacterium]
MRILRYFGIFVLTCILAMVLWIGYLFFTLPKIKHLEDYRPALVTTVYADDGEILGEFFVQRRYFVPLDKIPTYLVKAFIAAEDERFYEHKGLDWLSMIRAAIKDIRARAIVQGGSTITQQTVKSLLLSPKRTFSRKMREIILAYQLEKNLTKEEILTIYLNQIYFGHGAYGVEAAARVYFGKHVWELNLAEAAMLAGLPKGPAYYSPYRNMQRAKTRQQYVLNRMVTCGYITPAEAEQAFNTPLILNSLNYKHPACAYFLEYVRQSLLKKYGYDLFYKGGLSIYTPANIALYQAAQQALLRGIAEIKARHPEQTDEDKIEGALLCLETHSGFIKVMLGGRDFEVSKFNRVIQARRQPGSAFKPIIYAAALDKGYTPASTVYDYPFIYINRTPQKQTVWKPHNYEGRFYGQISLRDALVHSRNAVTVRLLRNIGVKYVIDYARRLGISSPLTPDLSLALGSSGVSLLELTTAYSVFANQGQYIKPLAVIKIVDPRGNILEENTPEQQPAIGADTAYLMTNILEDVVKRGTGRRVRALKRPAAGKTGTTNNYTDAWFIGYTPNFVTGVWVGYDDMKSLGKHETGGRAAAPIWLYFMQVAEKSLPVRPFSIPPGVVFAKVDPKTGLLTSPEDAKGKIECFKKGDLSQGLNSLKKKKSLFETIYKDRNF